MTANGAWPLLDTYYYYTMAKLFKGDGVAKNFSVLALCNFAVHIFNFLINMYLARELGPNGFGEYGVFITWAAIIQSVSSLGIQQVTIRNIARDNENSNFHFFMVFEHKLCYNMTRGD